MADMVPVNPDPEPAAEPQQLRRIRRAEDPSPPVEYEWLERAMHNAPSIQELEKLVKLRGDLIRQDEKRLDDQQRREERIADNNHRRRMDAVTTLTNIAKAAAGMGMGYILTIKGYPYPGMFALGVGLYSVAPKFVTDFFHRRRQNNTPELPDQQDPLGSSPGEPDQ